MRASIILTALAFGAVANGSNYMGFNAGNMKGDGTVKVKSDFVNEFTKAQELSGTNGKFNSFRLYTNIQGGTTNTPIEAFEAAVDTGTNILLGIWASGTKSIDNELAALQSAMDTIDGFSDIVVGISIGSEDLYRDGPIGQSDKAGVGAGPDTIVGFIRDYKNAVKGTSLEGILVGHVDTYDAWTNSTNSIVIDEIDWLGFDEYPYFEKTHENAIQNGLKLFNNAYLDTVDVAGGRPVWVTETGWPFEGSPSNSAVASVSNAKTFYDEVGCGELFGETPVFWYNLLDDTASSGAPLFGIYDDSTGQPRFDLSCGNVQAKLPSTDTTTSTTHTSTKPTSTSTKAPPTSTSKHSVAPTTKTTTTSTRSSHNPTTKTTDTSTRTSSNGPGTTSFTSSGFISSTVTSSTSSLSTSNPNPDNGGSSSKSNGLSTGAKAGIAVGAILGVGLIIILIWFCVTRRRKEENNRASQQPMTQTYSTDRPEMDGTSKDPYWRNQNNPSELENSPTTVRDSYQWQKQGNSPVMVRDSYQWQHQGQWQDPVELPATRNDNV